MPKPRAVLFDIGSTLWSSPPEDPGALQSCYSRGRAILIEALGDAPPVEAPLNAVAAHARAALNLRVHPRQDVHQAQDALVAHLEAARPFGVPLTVTRGEAGNGFAGGGDGPASRAARAALREAWGIDAVDMASGGSIPLVMSLQQAAPAAEILMFGSTDGYSNIHAPNERVLLTEFEAATVAKVEFVEGFAREWTSSRSEEEVT